MTAKGAKRREKEEGDGKPCGEARYLRSLNQRNSPLATQLPAA